MNVLLTHQFAADAQRIPDIIVAEAV